MTPTDSDHSQGPPPELPFLTVIQRGLARRCPACGEGATLTGYLTRLPRCAACGLDLSDIRADDGDGVRLSATNVRPLDEALANASTELQIVIEDEKAIPGIRHALDTGEPGKCKVALIVDVGDHQEVEVKLPKKIALTGDFRAAVVHLPGVAAVLDP